MVIAMFNEKCVFAGSFDPVTIGHMDIIGKCAMMFESVIVAIGVNDQKKYTFPLATRLKMLQVACEKYSSVMVKSFDGYVADFLKAENTRFYVRGIRNGKDIEFEEKSFEFSVKLYPEMETFFVNCSKDTKNISSSFVKQLIVEGKSIDKYIPPEALPVLKDFIK